MLIILFFLFLGLFFDIYFLKKAGRQLFKDTFNIPPLKALFGCLLIVIIAVYSPDRPADLPALILLIIFPIYLIRRQQFVERMQHGESPSSYLLSDALGVIVQWMYGVTVFGLLTTELMNISGDFVSPMGDLVLSALFSSALIFGLVYFASARFSDGDFLTRIGLRKGSQAWGKIVWIPAVLGLFFAVFSSYITIARNIQPQTPLSEIIETTQSLGLVLIFLFLAVAIAPLIEEIVFRGYFFHVVREWLGTRKAIYIIASTFAILHVGQYWGDWMAIVMVTLLGFTLTLLRAWTGTTIASTVTHYVYNAAVTIIPIAFMSIANPPYFEYKAYYSYHDAQTKEALLKKAIENQPDLADAYNDLAWLYAEEEINLERALSLVDQALKFAPEHPAYLDTKAQILEKLGRNAQAQDIRKRLSTK